jgi:hypothetical protein
MNPPALLQNSRLIRHPLILENDLNRLQVQRSMLYIIPL